MMPQTIERYEVRARLGQGGMATVFHAYDPRFKRDVAIKVLPREFLHDSTFRARFEREAQTIATLEHSAIVSVYDFGEHDGQPYLVMQYMPGGSLADRIRQGPLSVQDTAAIIGRIASALDAAHSRGIIHRDIKPANILFDSFHEARLADFGIVRLGEGTAQLTGSGIVGTPTYMAPEMAQEGGLSPLVDVYALGVTVYEMLAGSQPYKADTPMGVIMAHIGRPVPNILEQRPDLPETIQQVIERSMAKDPADRFQSAGELARALSAVAGQAVTMTAQPAPAVEPMIPTMVMEGQVTPEEVLMTEQLEAPAAIGEATVHEPTPAMPRAGGVSAPRVEGGPAARPGRRGGGMGLLVVVGIVAVLAVVICGVILLLGSITATAPGWVLLYADDGIAYGDTTSELADKLEELHDDGESVRQVAIGSGSAYVILYGDNSIAYADIAESLEAKLTELYDDGHKVWQVALGPGDGWVILYGDRAMAYENVPTGLAEKLSELYDDGETVWQVTIGAGDSWVLLYAENSVAYANIPESLEAKLKELHDDDLQIYQVALTLDTGWVVIYGEDGIAYEGIPEDAAEKMLELRDDGQAVWHIGLTSGVNAGVLGQ